MLMMVGFLTLLSRLLDKHKICQHCSLEQGVELLDRARSFLIVFGQ
jgi:hypothetical protein